MTRWIIDIKNYPYGFFVSIHDFYYRHINTIRIELSQPIFLSNTCPFRDKKLIGEIIDRLEKEKTNLPTAIPNINYAISEFQRIVAEI